MVDNYTNLNIKLITDKKLVTREGTDIRLSNKEYLLLEYLLTNSGKVLTKTQIIDHVWGYRHDILPDIVEAYVRKLREKVDAPFKNTKPLIRTVRGFGYKIDFQ